MLWQSNASCSKWSSIVDPFFIFLIFYCRVIPLNDVNFECTVARQKEGCEMFDGGWETSVRVLRKERKIKIKKSRKIWA